MDRCRGAARGSGGAGIVSAASCASSSGCRLFALANVRQFPCPARNLASSILVNTVVGGAACHRRRPRLLPAEQARDGIRYEHLARFVENDEVEHSRHRRQVAGDEQGAHRPARPEREERVRRFLDQLAQALERSFAPDLVLYGKSLARKLIEKQPGAFSGAAGHPVAIANDVDPVGRAEHLLIAIDLAHVAGQNRVRALKVLQGAGERDVPQAVGCEYRIDVLTGGDAGSQRVNHRPDPDAQQRFEQGMHSGQRRRLSSARRAATCADRFPNGCVSSVRCCMRGASSRGWPSAGRAPALPRAASQLVAVLALRRNRSGSRTGRPTMLVTQ